MSLKSYSARRFPLTLRGTVVLLLAAATTGIGVARVELAALTWGAVLLMLCVYAIIAGAIFARLARRTVQRGAVVRLATSTPAQILGKLDLSDPVRRPPGFRVRHTLSLRWDGGRAVSADTPIPRGARSVPITIHSVSRGLFEGNSGAIEVADLFGLTRFALPIGAERRVVVPPTAAETSAPRDRTAGGEPLPDEPRRDRSDDLLEVRRYVPGDDVRRLSWKHYAHVGELLLRIGEEIPPPNREVVCVLASDAGTHAVSATADLADAVVSRFASIVSALSRDGITVRPVIPTAATPNAEEALAERLADFRLVEADLPSLSVRANQTVVIVAAEGSASAAALARRLSGTTARVHHLEVSVPPSAPDRRRLLTRILLKPFGRTQVGGASAFVLLLRVATLAFLTLHYRFFVRDLLSVPFAFAALAVGLLVAYGLASTRLRGPWTAAVGIAAPWLLRLLFSLLFVIEQSLVDGLGVDAQNLVFDHNFFAALPVYYVVWALTQWLATARGPDRWEPPAHGVLLVAVFWTQAHYQLTIYDHPSIYAVALTGFVIIEVLLLLALSRRGRSREREPLRRDLASFTWLIVPLLLVFTVFVLGRYTEGSLAAGGGLIRPTLFRFDFSQYVTLESEISMSDDLVLLYRRSGRPKRELLRRFVLSGYAADRGFFHDPRPGLSEQPTTVPDGRRTFAVPPLDSRVRIQQDYFLVNFDPTSLLALNQPVEVVPYEEWDDSSFSRAYRVTSMVSDLFAYELVPRRPPEMSDAFADYYTSYGDNEPIAALARDITKGMTGYYQQVKQIEQYLLSNYYYSLKPGIAPDGDQLSHFLFTSKKGYCSYYAFAMALMVRSLGIPARVAVGFFVDPNQEVLNFYPITAQMAHAWVEVYFGDLGWIEFDPTSQQLAPDEEFEFSMGADRDELQSLLEEILDAELVEREAAGTNPYDASDRRRMSIRVGDIPLVFWYVLLPALYLVAMLVQKRAGDLAGRLSADPRVACRRRYRSLERRLSAVGFRRQAGQVPTHFARTLGDAGVDAVDVARLYERARFAPHFTNTDRAAFAAALAKTERSLSRTVGPWRRALGFLNPIAPTVGGHVEVPV